MGQGDPGSQHQTGVTLALADVPNISFGESDLAHVAYGSMLLKKSFSTADQNFSRPLVRFSDKYVRDLVS